MLLWTGIRKCSSREIRRATNLTGEREGVKSEKVHVEVVECRWAFLKKGRILTPYVLINCNVVIKLLLKPSHSFYNTKKLLVS